MENAIYSSYDDIARHVSEQIENIDISQYFVCYDDLLEILTTRFIDMQFLNGFSYGNFLRDYTVEGFFDLVADLEIDVHDPRKVFQSKRHQIVAASCENAACIMNLINFNSDICELHADDFVEITRSRAVASCINDFKGGAIDDGYYECETHDEKIDYVIEISLRADECLPVEKRQAKLIVAYLDSESDNLF